MTTARTIQAVMIGGSGRPKVFDDCAVNDCSQPGPAPLTSVESVPSSAPTTTELIPSVTTSGSSPNRWHSQPDSAAAGQADGEHEQRARPRSSSAQGRPGGW